MMAGSGFCQEEKVGGEGSFGFLASWKTDMDHYQMRLLTQPYASSLLSPWSLGQRVLASGSILAVAAHGNLGANAKEAEPRELPFRKRDCVLFYT